jgi:hypothetical protein
MSEYQYYEFQALDRPLSSEDQAYIRTLSSRVQLTATQAQFVYHYGDFRGQPKEVLDRCFDMMAHVASFGVRQLMIRFPKSLMNPAQLEPYCVKHAIAVETTERSTILNIHLVREDYYGWIKEEEYLASLVPLREDLMRGDLRSLYLAWLAAGDADDVNNDPTEFTEPPVPANLKQLSAPLKAFADLFQIDEDLITAAAEGNPSAKSMAEPISDWIAALSESDRNAYLLRVVQRETHVGVELLMRLRQEFGQPATPLSESAGRTFAQLQEKAEEQHKQRERRAQQAAEKAKQKRLTELAPQADQLWQEALRLIEFKQSKPYDEAVIHLLDLRDLAEHQGKLADFQNEIGALARRYSTRSGLLSRLRKVSLI